MSLSFIFSPITALRAEKTFSEKLPKYDILHSWAKYWPYRVKQYAINHEYSSRPVDCPVLRSATTLGFDTLGGGGGG